MLCTACLRERADYTVPSCPGGLDECLAREYNLVLFHLRGAAAPLFFAPYPMADRTPIPDGEELQPTEVQGTSADSVLAETVHMRQSVARRVEGGDVEIRQSAAGQVRGHRVTAHTAAVGLLQAPTATLQSSAVGALRAEHAYLNGAAGGVAANTVEFGSSYAGVVAGREIRAERVDSLVLLAGKVEGEVHATMSTREALIAGILGGLIAGLFLLLGRALFGRR
jgi:hypothetical protein